MASNYKSLCIRLASQINKSEDDEWVEQVVRLSQYLRDASSSVAGSKISEVSAIKDELLALINKLGFTESMDLHFRLVRAFVRVYHSDAKSKEPKCWQCKKSFQISSAKKCDVCGWLLCKDCQVFGCQYSDYLNSVEEQFKHNTSFLGWLEAINEVFRIPLDKQASSLFKNLSRDPQVK